MITLLLWVVWIGVLVWMVNNWIPMDPKVQQMFNLLVAVGIIIWLAQAFGLIGPVGPFRFDKVD